LGSFFTILIVALTSISVVGLGIISAYGIVIMILHSVSYQSSPAQITPLAFATSEPQASGD
jgi:hypothetical protein